MSASGTGTAPGRRDRFEWLVLAALFALAFAVLAGLALRTLISGGWVTGGDGFLVVDPLQYLNWIRQSADHLAAANLYDFAPPRHTFVHPGVIASGVAHRLGLNLVLAYALAKPAAVVILFLGSVLLVRRHLSARGDRRFALTVALFYCAPAAALGGIVLGPGSPTKIALDFAGGEVWTGSYLWGYAFTAIAVGLVPLGLWACERSAAGGWSRWRALALCCALFASWLQPWQGATLLIVLGVAFLIEWKSRRLAAADALRSFVPIAVFGTVPLLYYFILAKVDPAWELAGEANAIGRWPLWVLAVTVAPLVLPAAFAFRRGDFADFGSAVLRLWPAAALLVYFLPLGTFPFHAVQGVQIPLAILATVAWRRHLGNRPLPAISAIVIAALLIIPGTSYRASQMRDAVKLGVQPFFLTDDEHAALEFIARDRRGGGVLTENYLATVIPAWTGRATWFGAGSWTPDFKLRRELATELFDGVLSESAARRLVVRPGAGYLLDSCRARPGFLRSVRTFTTIVWQRGCVTVLKVEGVPAAHADVPALPRPVLEPR